MAMADSFSHAGMLKVFFMAREFVRF